MGQVTEGLDVLLLSTPSQSSCNGWRIWTLTCKKSTILSTRPNECYTQAPRLSNCSVVISSYYHQRSSKALPCWILIPWLSWSLRKLSKNIIKYTPLGVIERTQGCCLVSRVSGGSDLRVKFQSSVPLRHSLCPGQESHHMSHFPTCLCGFDGFFPQID